MASKYLDNTGLQKVWTKIKALLSSKIDTDGNNTTSAGVSTMMNKLESGNGVPNDNTYYISQDVNGTSEYNRRPVSRLYDYIKSKTDNLYATKTQLANTDNNVSQMQATINKEAYLAWGGKNFSGGFGAIDACLVPSLGANRLAFAKPAGITIEYSRDSGATWNDYGASNGAKTIFFTDKGTDFAIGKADSTNKATPAYMLRVTMDTGTAQVYTQLHKFVIYVNTNGSSACYCTIEKALQATPTTFVTVVNKASISGWSGYNVLNVPAFVTYGNNANEQYGKIRFTFGCTANNSNYSGLIIRSIQGFGGMGWTTPSVLARTGLLYSYNENQDATFPAMIKANNGTNVSLAGHTHGASDIASGTLSVDRGGTGQASLDDVTTGKAKGVVDYNKADNTIQIGWAGESLTSCTYLAAYSGNAPNIKLKDIKPESITCGNSTKLNGQTADYYAKASHTHTKADITDLGDLSVPTAITNSYIDSIVK